MGGIAAVGNGNGRIIGLNQSKGFGSGRRLLGRRRTGRMRGIIQCSDSRSIVHPLEIGDFARKFPVAKRLPERFVEGVFRRVPALKLSTIRGIRSATGVEAEGWFIACPLTARQMLELPVDKVLRKIIQAGKKAEELGAPIVGLGAFTAVVGDAGITVSESLSIAVTTGNSYTVATALEGIEYAAERMEVNLADTRIAILGASGSIGKACARILADAGLSWSWSPGIGKSSKSWLMSWRAYKAHARPLARISANRCGEPGSSWPLRARSTPSCLRKIFCQELLCAMSLGHAMWRRA